MTNEIHTTPILCGGTFFTLLLQAVKQGKNERNVYGTKKTAFTEGDVLNGLIQITSPSYIRPECDVNFRSAVSTYKNCHSAKTYRFVITEQAIVSSFDNRIKTEYAKSLTSMSAFVDSFINVVDRGLWIIRALLELILSDQTILSTNEFYVFQDGNKCTKAFLADQSHICLPSFLLGIWHFIVINRNDNSIGTTTIESWHTKAKTKGSKKEFISKIGDGIQNQIFLLPLPSKSTENIKTDTTTADAETTEDSSTTTEPYVTANNSGVCYQQNNYSQTFNVNGGTNTFTGFVINSPDKGRQDD